MHVYVYVCMNTHICICLCVCIYIYPFGSVSQENPNALALLPLQRPYPHLLISPDITFSRKPSGTFSSETFATCGATCTRETLPLQTWAGSWTEASAQLLGFSTWPPRGLEFPSQKVPGHLKSQSGLGSDSRTPRAVLWLPDA